MARIPSKASGQPGGALALSGGGFIQGENAADDILTIQGSSAHTGDLFNISTYKAGRTDETGEVVNVDSSGAMRVGKVQVVAIASGSTAYTVLSSNSGKYHIVPGFSSGAKITLPAHDEGLNYKFFFKAVTSSDGVMFNLPSTPGSIVYDAETDNATIVAATAADMVGGAAFEMFSDGTNWFFNYDDPGATAAALLTVAAT